MTPRQKYAAIVAEVAADHGVEAEHIAGQCRARLWVRARWDAWYRLRRATGWTYPQMASVIGADHSSIIYGIQRHCAVQGLPPVDGEPAFRSIRSQHEGARA